MHKIAVVEHKFMAMYMPTSVCLYDHISSLYPRVNLLVCLYVLSTNIRQTVSGVHFRLLFDCLFCLSTY